MAIALSAPWLLWGLLWFFILTKILSHRFWGGPRRYL
jgi:hypothetical protein